MKYAFNIISTEETKDHSDTIKIGTILYGPSVLHEVTDEDLADSYSEAEQKAQNVLTGLDGGKAFNAARDSARIQVVEYRLCDRFGDRGVWNEHPEYPREDWQYEVANNDTVAGYWDWVEVRIEQDEDD